MSLDKAHLEYSHRHYGMDHARYEWSMLSRRPPITWPGSARLALWVNVAMQFFPLDQRGIPFAVPGGMTMPYPFHTPQGELVAMPLSNELEDRFVLMNNLHSEQSWLEQVCDACDFLLQEAQTQGGRILALNIHPWLLVQPHRVAKLEQALSYITAPDGVWSAYACEIMDAWQAQTAGA